MSRAQGGPNPHTAGVLFSDQCNVHRHAPAGCSRQASTVFFSMGVLYFVTAAALSRSLSSDTSQLSSRRGEFPLGTHYQNAYTCCPGGLCWQFCARATGCSAAPAVACRFAPGRVWLGALHSLYCFLGVEELPAAASMQCVVISCGHRRPACTLLRTLICAFVFLEWTLAEFKPDAGAVLA